MDGWIIISAQITCYFIPQHLDQQVFVRLEVIINITTVIMFPLQQRLLYWQISNQIKSQCKITNLYTKHTRCKHVAPTFAKNNLKVTQNADNSLFCSSFQHSVLLCRYDYECCRARPAHVTDSCDLNKSYHASPNHIW